MAYPPVPAMPPAPSRADDGNAFSAKADATFAQMPNTISGMNTLGAYLDGVGAAVDADAAAAASSAANAAQQVTLAAEQVELAELAANVAASAANFKGEWSSATAYLLGDSVVYEANRYVALRNNTNQTPDVATLDWYLIKQGNDLIRKPIAISPLTGATGVLPNTTLEATAYAPVYSIDPRDYRLFQVALATDPSFSAPVFTGQVNANSIQVTPNLGLEQIYRWRCKDVSLVAGEVIESDWMDSQQFTTANITVNAPMLTVQGAPMDVPESPLLTTNAFSTTPAGEDTHASTDWEVRLAATNVLVYSSYNDTVNLLSLTVPKGVLLENTLYRFRVRHNGAIYGPSAYTQVEATTLLQFAFGKYLSVAHDATPFVTIYGQDVDTFTKLANPVILPTFTGYSTVFSADGTYLAVAHQESPYITIYKRSGDTFTKLANPATLPAGNAFGAAFSADGVYLSVAHNLVPLITIYKRSGDTFTKLADPATLPTSTANGTAFSADGTYLAVAHSNSPFITIYKRSGDTFTKLADPATLPTGNGTGTAFSADGTYLAVGQSANSPFITIYKRSGDTFSKLANPSPLPGGGAVLGVSFSADGTYLAVASNGTPFINIYKRNGDAFSRLANPTTLPPSVAYSPAFSADGNYLAVAHGTTPFITIYKRSGDTFTKLADPATLPTGTGRGSALFPRAFEYAIGPWHVVGARPAEQFSVAAQETGPTGVTFNTDGTRMFVVGANGVAVHRYDLATPWVVNTATFVNSFSVSAQDTAPTDIAFSTDGLKMFVVGSTNDNVYEYTLTTAFTPTTATFTRQFSVGGQDTTPTGLDFSPDGLNMYIVGSVNDSVHQYSLPSAFNLTGATLVRSFSVAEQDGGPQSIRFKPDGTLMYVLGTNHDRVYEYELGAPFNISTAVYRQALGTLEKDTSPTGLAFKSDGTRLFFIGQANDAVYAYDLPAALEV